MSVLRHYYRLRSADRDELFDRRKALSPEWFVDDAENIIIDESVPCLFDNRPWMWDWVLRDDGALEFTPTAAKKA